MTPPVEPHPFDRECEHLKKGSCWSCCNRCNYNQHICPMCGDDIGHNGNGPDGKTHPCLTADLE